MGDSDLIQRVKEAVRYYAGNGEGLHLRLLTIFDDEQGIYTVVAIDEPRQDLPVGVVVLARIDRDRVIIEEDRTDRPLWEQLVQRGVDRSAIVLTYADETVNNTQSSV